MGKFDEMNGLICSRSDGLTFQLRMVFFFFLSFNYACFGRSSIRNTREVYTELTTDPTKQHGP